MTGILFFLLCLALLVALIWWRRPEWILVTSPDDDGERAPRCRFLRRHHWERPATVNGVRLQSCLRCPASRPVEWVTPPVGRPAREMLDGTTATLLVGADADEAIRAYQRRRVTERAFDRVKKARAS